jgi:MFS superfamily sulfate permease-like transporter
MRLGDPAAWGANWAWGIPLIVLTSVIHVLGLGLINEKVVRMLGGMMDHRHFTSVFAVAMSATVLLATLLHALEAIV